MDTRPIATCFSEGSHLNLLRRACARIQICCREVHRYYNSKCGRQSSLISLLEPQLRSPALLCFRCPKTAHDLQIPKREFASREPSGLLGWCCSFFDRFALLRAKC